MNAHDTIMNNIKDLVGETCTGIGTCGISKDVEVTGTLLNRTIGGDPIIQCEKGRLHSVDKKTVKKHG